MADDIMGDFQPFPPYLWNHKKYQIQPCPGIQSWWDNNNWLTKIIWIFMNIQLLFLVITLFEYDFQGYTPKILRNKKKRHKIINMQKLWRQDYNLNVNKDQLPLLAFTRIFAMKGHAFISFKSTTHDIIEFNPVFLVIVASHIRPRALSAWCVRQQWPPTQD